MGAKNLSLYIVLSKKLRSYKRRLEMRRRWRLKNKDRINLKARNAWYTDGGALKERAQKWKSENKEHRKLYNREYCKENRDKIKIYMHNANVRRRAITRLGKITKAEWLALVAAFDYCCAYCTKRVSLTIDHVVPLIMGGEHSIDNVLPACVSCNCSKGGKNLLVWMVSKHA